MVNKTVLSCLNLNDQSGRKKAKNFNRDYLDNVSDSEFTVKTKNAPFL
jgi:hypothetical protein